MDLECEDKSYQKLLKDRKPLLDKRMRKIQIKRKPHNSTVASKAKISALQTKS
jgi:hypothetical protein